MKKNVKKIKYIPFTMFFSHFIISLFSLHFHVFSLYSHFCRFLQHCRKKTTHRYATFSGFFTSFAKILFLYVFYYHQHIFNHQSHFQKVKADLSPVSNTYLYCLRPFFHLLTIKQWQTANVPHYSK